MKREAKLFEWICDFRTVQEIADRHDVEYPTAYGWVRAGHVTIDTIIGGGKIKRPRNKNKTIVAARVKPELPKPVRVNENAIIRVRNLELDKSLNYLAKTTKQTYQAASEEFINYIMERHLWGQDSITVLQQRLFKHGNSNGNGQHEESEVYAPMPEEKKGRAMELLANALEEIDLLREEKESLQAKVIKLQNIVRKFRNLMSESGIDND